MDNDKSLPLEKLADTETEIEKHQKGEEKINYKSRNKHRLYNYWEEHPILRFIPSTFMYLGGKLIRKL